MWPCDEFVGVSFLPEVEVRGHRMLEEVDDQIAEQDEESGIFSVQLETRRDHLDHRGGQHESCAQRDEVLEVSPLPVPVDDDGAAENVGQRRR